MNGIPPRSPVAIAATATTSSGLNRSAKPTTTSSNAEQRPVVDHLLPPARIRRRPGVSITKRSPGCISADAVALSISTLPSVRSTQLRPGCASAAAGDAARRHTPAVGENVGAHRLEEGHRADHAVAAAVRALPARAAADRELVEPHRQPRLEDFRIGQAAVGHVRLHRARPVMIGPGARTAGDRLVILVALVAEGEIVHRPLARRKPPGRGEQARRSRPGWSRHCRRPPPPDISD